MQCEQSLRNRCELTKTFSPNAETSYRRLLTEMHSEDRNWNKSSIKVCGNEQLQRQERDVERESRADVIVIQRLNDRNGQAHTGWADCLFPLKEKKSIGLSAYLQVTYYPQTIILLIASFHGLIEWISSSCTNDNSFISFSGWVKMLGQRVILQYNI